MSKTRKTKTKTRTRTEFGGPAILVWSGCDARRYTRPNRRILLAALRLWPAAAQADRVCDDLIFAFSDEGDRSFVRIMRDGVPAGHGWAILDIDNSVCENLAG